MSDITRKKLTKGTKLQAQPVDDFFTSVASAIQNRELDKDNLPYESGFELNYSIDSIGWTADTETQQQAWTFPFILPEPQDTFSRTFQLSSTSTPYTLRRIVFSLDQGDEPIVWFPYQKHTHVASGQDHTMGTVKGGMSGVSFELNIFKKTPSIVANQIKTWETELVSFTIPGTAFNFNNMGQNPYVLENINKLFSSDSAYCMSLQFFGDQPAADADLNRNAMIKNLQISLEFSTALRVRDQQGGTDDNPTGMANNPVLYGDGSDSPDTISLGPITPGDTIQADPLQTNIEELDKKVQRKMSGGYSSKWSKPQFQEQLDIQAYDAFVVPLFNNNYNYKTEGMDLLTMPYTRANPTLTPDQKPTPPGADVSLDRVYDRRVIPITEPFEIHHVFLCYEGRDTSGPSPTISSHATPGGIPLVNTGTLELELFMGSGWGSDWYGTESLAYWQEANWNDTNIVDAGVDPLVQTIAQQEGETRTRIIQIPLNYEAAATNSEGFGYYNNGIPAFVGRGVGYNSNDRTQHVRTRGIAPTIAHTKGQEKFLHILMGWYGLPYNTAVDGPGEFYGRDLLANGGAHLLIIGKKSLVRSEW